jgi:protein-S-isoprenylcysteine O-methyltransferase Ste14
LNVLKQIRAVVMLPFAVTVVVPALLVYLTDSAGMAWSVSETWDAGLYILSFMFIASGLFLGFQTVMLFAKEGEGTLAPWDPTRKLVILGPYRYVRNPMISGAFCILIGEVLLLGSVYVLCWLLFFMVANFIYIPVSEEPGLAQRFGADYALYKKHVPRWIPRRTPWDFPRRGGMT